MYERTLFGKGNNFKTCFDYSDILEYRFIF